MDIGIRALRSALAAGSVFVLCHVAQAQSSTPANGEWSATWVDDKGRDRSATVHLAGDTGTWHALPVGPAGNKSNPCFSIVMPVTVRPGGADELVLDVDGAQVVAGCPAFTATLKRVDDKSFDGTMGSGRSLHLSRQ